MPRASEKGREERNPVVGHRFSLMEISHWYRIFGNATLFLYLIEAKYKRMHSKSECTHCDKNTSNISRKKIYHDTIDDIMCEADVTDDYRIRAEKTQ